MLIYNVTTKVDWSINDAWLEWTTGIHIPEMMATGLFTDYRVVKLLEVDDIEGPTYAIQYYTRNRADYDQYIKEFAPAMTEKGTKRWGQQFIAFRTLMEVIN
jgi:hypothetical protein